jgi:hypothetical protein
MQQGRAMSVEAKLVQRKSIPGKVNGLHLVYRDGKRVGLVIQPYYCDNLYRAYSNGAEVGQFTTLSKAINHLIRYVKKLFAVSKISENTVDKGQLSGTITDN